MDLLEWKPCKYCKEESMIGCDNICDNCWEIKTRIEFMEPHLIVLLLKSTLVPEKFLEIQRLMES